MQIEMVFRPQNANLTPPAYQSEGASGFDLAADIPEGQSIVLEPGQRAFIQTGIYLAIPQGFEMQVRSRSGHARRHALVVTNQPGTVDSDFRGEVAVMLINLGVDTISIHPGDRVAQGVICPVIRAEFALVETLDETARGASGYGSTGVNDSARSAA